MNPADQEGSVAGPASFGQEQMWHTSLSHPDLPLSHIVFGRRLRGPLDARQLERAMTKVIERQCVLRTALGVENGVLQQIIVPAEPVRLPVVDLGAAPSTSVEETIRTISCKTASASFDLTRPGLYRLQLFRVADGHHVLVMVVHHAVFDGLSMGVFDDELHAAYEGRNDLDELPIRYADYSRAQRDAWASGVFSVELDYWRERLRTMGTAVEFPADRTGPRAPFSRRALVSTTLSGTDINELRKYAARRRSTLFHVLFATLVTLVHKFTGATDIAVVVPTSGRKTPELMRLIGLFSNAVILRVDINDNPSFDLLVDRVGEITLNALDNQRVPLVKVSESAPNRRLYSIIFDYHRRSFATHSMREIDMSAFDVNFDGQLAADLDINVGTDGDRMLIQIGYRSDTFERATTRSYLNTWQALLRAVPTGSQCSIGHLARIDYAFHSVD